MAPSASKQKRLAEKAMKNAEKGLTGSSKSTPAGSVAGGSTPMTSLSANASDEALADAQAEMKRLNLATDRSAVRSSAIFTIWNHTNGRTVSWCPTLKDVISRLTSTLCLSTVVF